eukprot:6949621-Pyramimonas_sp.AAC.1
MASESLATESALDVQYATRRRIQEALRLDEPPAGLLLTDSRSLVTNTYSTTPHITEEDLTPSLHRIREARVGMVADPLTKPNSNPSKILDPIRSCSIDLRSPARPTSAASCYLSQPCAAQGGPPSCGLPAGGKLESAMAATAAI